MVSSKSRVFFYKPGGGPLLDIGPYYITALLSLLGPVKKVAVLCPEERLIKELLKVNLDEVKPLKLK
ncbi:hypothetical protein GCM10020331_050460 [Ectobacillus funiculus]